MYLNVIIYEERFNKTNRLWTAHTEQEISAIIRTSVFCVDRTCFPDPVTYAHVQLKIATMLNKNYSNTPIHNVLEYSCLLVVPPITRILSATPTTAAAALAAGIFVRYFH